jgi:excisionase family DNA binding protein
VTEPDELLTVEEVAEMARVHPETVRRWIKNKRLPAARPTGKPQSPYRIHSTDVARLLGGLPKGAAANSPQPSVTEEERREAEMLDELPEELREQLIEELDELGLETLVALQVKGFAKGTLLHAAVERALARVSARTGIRGGWEETEYSARLREQREQREARASGVDDTEHGATEAG